MRFLILWDQIMSIAVQIHAYFHYFSQRDKIGNNILSDFTYFTHFSWIYFPWINKIGNDCYSDPWINLPITIDRGRNGV